MSITKAKRYVVLNGGDQKFDFRHDLDSEFRIRYDNLKKEFDKLMDEVHWNSILYDKEICEIKFNPVINKHYYLYGKDGKFSMSLISPDEWKRDDYVGKFLFSYNGKWVKID